MNESKLDAAGGRTKDSAKAKKAKAIRNPRPEVPLNAVRANSKLKVSVRDYVSRPNAIGAKNNGLPKVVDVEGVPNGRPEASLEFLEIKNRHLIRLMLCCCLIFTAVFSTVGCFALMYYFILSGRPFSEASIHWLSGVTIAQDFVLLGVFVRSVWEVNTEKRAVKVKCSH